MLEQKSEATVRGHKSSLSTFLNFVDVTEPALVLAKDIVRFRYAMYEAKESWHGDQQLIETSPAKQVKLLTEVEAFPKWIDVQ
ncbi:hypothetical protein AB0Y38_18225 [Lysinibacillus capsici]|uniref:hypothetical protein n=1 Tax=Lysinibacillus capsici TaxID=2115968 RepID=UPI003F232D71